MTTEEVKHILDVIWTKAKVPTVSFTGGEPTLRKDLVELVKYAVSIGLRVNLITNGIVCGTTDLPQRLKDAGLSSAQVSLESAVPEIHDKIVGHKGAFEHTVGGFKRLKSLGIHTHINTTICKDNIDTVHTLPKFAKEELGLEYQSMNMVIRTGHACDHPDEIGYTDVAVVLPKIHDEARKNCIRLVWYSPMPYCIINTVAEGIGSTTCAAADGLLSVAPDGSVLPCSSFSNGFGNLLTQDFDEVWFSRPALYFRRKEFLPPKCKACEHASKCMGACPLYWDNMGEFSEIPGPNKAIGDMIWKARRNLVGKCKPVSGVGKRGSKKKRGKK
jgi:radical SAM protein with 4Fe4S-binding SPASM domain